MIEAGEITWDGGAGYGSAILNTTTADREYAVVFWLCFHPEKIREIDLEALDFTDPTMQRVFIVLSDALEKGRPVQQITDLVEIQGPQEDLGFFLGRAIADNFFLWGTPWELMESHAIWLKKERYLRTLRQDGERQQGAVTIEEAEGISKQSRGDLRRLRDRYVSADDVDTAPLVEILHETEGSRMKFGVEEIDRMTGGVPYGSVVTIIALPGCGKTAVAAQMIITALDTDSKTTALTCSVDMRVRELWLRHVMSFARMTENDIRNCAEGLEEWPEEVNRLQSLRRRYAIRNDLQSVQEIERAVLSMRPRPLLVMIDYLQAIRFGKGVMKETERITEIMPVLKRLAITIDGVILLVSQMKREGTDMTTMPTAQHGRGSSEIEASSRIVLGLCRPEHAMEVAKEKRVRELGVGVVKSNFGPICRTRIPYDTWYQSVG